jgi:SAM-dependent methyltransferase
MNAAVKRALRPIHFWFTMILFDPLEILRKIRGLPYFISNWRAFQRRNEQPSFRLKLGNIWYRAQDRFDKAGAAQGHYFFQDLWVANALYEQRVREHVDVGSRLDGFIAHILPFCAVTYVDIRPLDLAWPGFSFRPGSITDLPFADASVPSLSSLHVIEHIGLGRYGDPVDPLGFMKAAKELSRVLAPGGKLYIGTPIGRERTCFDAHRVFDPTTVVQAFAGLRLVDFRLIDDAGKAITRAALEAGRDCDYGCGVFVFEKVASAA